MERLTLREWIELIWRVMLIVLVALLIAVLWNWPKATHLPTLPGASQLPVYMQCTPTTNPPPARR